MGASGNEQHNDDDEDVCYLASVLLLTGDGPCTEDPDENTPDNWIAVEGITSDQRMTRLG